VRITALRDHLGDVLRLVEGAVRRVTAVGLSRLAGSRQSNSQRFAVATDPDKMRWTFETVFARHRLHRAADIRRACKSWSRPRGARRIAGLPPRHPYDSGPALADDDKSLAARTARACCKSPPARTAGRLISRDRRQRLARREHPDGRGTDRLHHLCQQVDAAGQQRERHVPVSMNRSRCHPGIAARPAADTGGRAGRRGAFGPAGARERADHPLM